VLWIFLKTEKSNGFGRVRTRELGVGGCKWPVSCGYRFALGERAPLYPLIKGLGGPQKCNGHFQEKKNFPTLSGIEPMVFNHPAHSLVTLSTELFRLHLDIMPVRSSSLQQLTLLTYFGSCIDRMPTQVISIV
jgi:hypothetical protein